MVTKKWNIRRTSRAVIQIWSNICLMIVEHEARKKYASPDLFCMSRSRVNQDEAVGYVQYKQPSIWALAVPWMNIASAPQL